MTRTPRFLGRAMLAAVFHGSARLALVAILLTGCSAGASHVPAPKATTTTVPAPRNLRPLRPTVLDPCHLVSLAELERAVGARLGSPHRGHTAEARSCGWRLASHPPALGPADIAVFVNDRGRTVAQFKEVVSRNFHGSSCTVQAVPVGDKAFFADCGDQGVGLDLSVRHAHVGFLVRASMTGPETGL